jgi:hypothetical protein
LDELLVLASDDWVMVATVDGLTRSVAARHRVRVTTEERVDTGIEVLKCALSSRLLIAGDLAKRPPHFSPWNLALSDTIERIAREWRTVGDNLQMGDICWFEDTAEGRKRAEKVRSQVNERASWPKSD